MQEVIKPLLEKKAANEAEIKKLKGIIWDLNVSNKAIDKAIKALDTTKENTEPGKAT